ncbi:MAG: conserved repeat domain [Acidobacteria bacterium]|nr:conserved repeat domain [Acidobacteriota bacterium]
MKRYPSQTHRILLLAILVPLLSIAVHAQVTLQHMKINGPYVTTQTNSSTSISGTTYTLPGYGPVRVTWVATPGSSLPFFNPKDVPSAYNQSAGGYTWGSDTQVIGINNSSAGAGTLSYIVTFHFQAGPPDVSKLVLMIAALANGTTATASQGVSLTGEYLFPVTPVSAPTRLTSGNFIESDWSNHTGSDHVNTGWALFKVPSPVGNSLSLRFSHIYGDGIAFTLGYAVDNGILKVCKVAGPGVALGTPVTFTAGSSTFTIPAGPAPGGTCVVGPSLPVGSTVTVAETIPAGDTVSSITVALPGQLVGTSNLAGGSVSVVIGIGVTEVTFTDEKRTGFLEICKTGKVTGSFTFNVNPGGLGPFVVPAGACSPAIEVAAGPVVITELPSPGVAMIGCNTIPTNEQGPCNLGAQTSTVTVVPGDISTMTIAFVANRRGP